MYSGAQFRGRQCRYICFEANGFPIIESYSVLAEKSADGSVLSY